MKTSKKGTGVTRIYDEPSKKTGRPPYKRKANSASNCGQCKRSLANPVQQLVEQPSDDSRLRYYGEGSAWGGGAHSTTNDAWMNAGG